ncbi:MAG: hypothetical protein K2O89_00135 [Clostridia bacterium]|nr:hypothetical protein [Clostridia bacterium]
MAKKVTKTQAKKAAKAAKKQPKIVIALAVIILLIVIAAVVLYFVKPDLYHKYLGIGDHNFDGNGVCTVCGYEKSETGQGNLEDIKEADFSIHFIELGNKSTGDCILIDCGETEVLIDAGSAKGSATTIKTYLDEYVDGDLEFVISTHSDEDHISALIGSGSGNNRTGIAYQYNIGTFIKFDKAGTDGNGKPLTTASGGKTLYGEYVDMVNYLKDDCPNTTVYTASECYEQKNGAQRQYFLDEEHKISINILYNYYYYNASSDENNYSVVTLLTQELSNGKKHYLFTGDLEKDGESKMVDYYASASNSKSAYDVLPEVELYKAGHHGSRTSSTAKLMQVIKPKYVAVCCCCGAPQYTTVNDNTFPTQEMLDNVGKYTDKIYVTTLGTGFPEKDEDGNYTSRSYGGYESMNGNIVFYYKDGKLNLYCSNNDTILKDTEWFKENRVWNGV